MSDSKSSFWLMIPHVSFPLTVSFPCSLLCNSILKSFIPKKPVFWYSVSNSLETAAVIFVFSVLFLYWNITLFNRSLFSIMAWNLMYVAHCSRCFQMLSGVFFCCCNKYCSSCLLIIPALFTGEMFILLFQLLYVSTVKCTSCSYSWCSDYWNTVVYV